MSCLRGALQRAGLSPRVRGNRRGKGKRPARRRSIPACAGEPLAGASVRRPERVYPRVCGGTARPVGLLE